MRWGAYDHAVMAQARSGAAGAVVCCRWDKVAMSADACLDKLRMFTVLQMVRVLTKGRSFVFLRDSASLLLPFTAYRPLLPLPFPGLQRGIRLPELSVLGPLESSTSRVGNPPFCQRCGRESALPFQATVGVGCCPKKTLRAPSAPHAPPPAPPPLFPCATGKSCFNNKFAVKMANLDSLFNLLNEIKLLPGEVCGVDGMCAGTLWQ